MCVRCNKLNRHNNDAFTLSDINLLDIIDVFRMKYKLNHYSLIFVKKSCIRHEDIQILYIFLIFHKMAFIKYLYYFMKMGDLERMFAENIYVQHNRPCETMVK